MRRKGSTSDLKTKAIELRVRGRKSFREISDDIGVSKGTLSVWLKEYPLSSDELANRYASRKSATEGPRDNTVLVMGSESKFHLEHQDLNPHQMGKLAEAAILFRLTLHGFRVFRAVSDGDRTDFVVLEGARFIKLQVKCVTKQSHGLPLVRLWHIEGFQKQKRYTEIEVDFIVGYWLYNDTAYVYSMKELEGNLAVKSITSDAAEAWSKLRVMPV
jgi:transposase-like protein